MSESVDALLTDGTKGVRITCVFDYCSGICITTTPARAESRWPQLPAVHEPHPVRAAPVRAVRSAPPPLPARPRGRADHRGAPPPQRRLPTPVAVGAVVGGAVVLGLSAGLGVRWLVRRRARHPAGV